MALSSSLAPPPPCGATQRSPHSNTKHRFVPRQFARRPRTCAAAAAPRRGASSSSNDAPSTAAAASASFADFPATCPWPRPPTYSEQPAVEVQATRSMKNRVLLMIAKLINGDTGALPPAVARLGGAFTDGCAVAESADENSSSSSSPLGGSSSSQSPLLRAAARLWRYQGMR